MNILNNISPIMALSGLTIGLIVVVAVLLVAVIVLYFIGRKAEKKQAEQEKTMKENAQTVSLFVIDKKKLKLKDSGLPSIVLEQTPKYARRAKVPIVKVKAGPRAVSYTHLDVYKRQAVLFFSCCIFIRSKSIYQ